MVIVNTVVVNNEKPKSKEKSEDKKDKKDKK